MSLETVREPYSNSIFREALREKTDLIPRGVHLDSISFPRNNPHITPDIPLGRIFTIETGRIRRRTILSASPLEMDPQQRTDLGYADIIGRKIKRDAFLFCPFASTI